MFSHSQQHLLCKQHMVTISTTYVLRSIQRYSSRKSTDVRYKVRQPPVHRSTSTSSGGCPRSVNMFLHHLPTTENATPSHHMHTTIKMMR